MIFLLVQAKTDLSLPEGSEWPSPGVLQGANGATVFPSPLKCCFFLFTLTPDTYRDLSSSVLTMPSKVFQVSLSEWVHRQEQQGEFQLLPGQVVPLL